METGLYIWNDPEEASRKRAEETAQRRQIVVGWLLIVVGAFSWALLLTGWGSWTWEPAPSATSSIPPKEQIFKEFQASKEFQDRIRHGR